MVGKRMAGILAACVLLGGCAANSGDKDSKEKTNAATAAATTAQTAAQTTAVTTAQVTTVTTAQTKTQAQKAAQARLLAAVKKKCPGWSAEQVLCGDYNADGAYELFAYMEKPTADETDNVGAIYFAGNDGVKRLLDEMPFAPYDISMCELGEQKMMLMSYSLGGSSSYANAWLVEKDGGVKAFEFLDELVQHDGGMEFHTGTSAFDMVVDGTGHTWKAYYYYWDGEKFREYGGIEITREQLLKADGAAQFLAQIKKDGGKPGKIFYRANGIININYTIEDRNENMTLVLEGGKVSEKVYENDDGDMKPVGSYQGIYVAAAHPDVATYPAEFPLG